MQIIDDPARNDECEVVNVTTPQTGQTHPCELREPLEPFGYGRRHGPLANPGEVATTARERTTRGDIDNIGAGVHRCSRRTSSGRDAVA